MLVCCKSNQANRSWWRKSQTWVAVLVFTAVLLFTTGWVVLLVPYGNMSDKYKFTPRSLATYHQWRTTTLVFVSIAFLVIGFTAFPDKSQCNRWILIVHCVVFAVLLIVGNAMAAHETSQRQAFEQGFAAKFNAFYCDVRTARLCLEGNQGDLAVLVYGSSPPTNQSGLGNSTNAVATSIWTRCRKVLLNFQALDAMAEWDDDGVRLYLSIYKFVDDCNKSVEMDMWCGDLAGRTTALTDGKQRLFPAPFSANADMFAKYTREWTRNMRYSNAILGSTIGCMALAAVLAKSK